jgi:hypothetical protein
MTKIAKLSFIGAVLAVGIASPAFAQSFDPEAGTGNVLGFNSVQTVPQAPQAHRATVRPTRLAARRSGVNAFAMVPGAAGGTAYDPAATGGGSVGYNQNIRNEW